MASPSVLGVEGGVDYVGSDGIKVKGTANGTVLPKIVHPTFVL
ncbi:hypothetical protein A2U01_0059676 [Trifolium medium]|uniref:Uncharacterized protein n=1 Tax=Trifolium medium TaxID=97028 RepID=A0A392RP66_9FABA|nr:hypothetical protein [Trifolium medium]